MKTKEKFVATALDLAMVLVAGKIRTTGPDFVQMLQAAREVASGERDLTPEDWELQDRILEAERETLHGGSSGPA